MIPSKPPVFFKIVPVNPDGVTVVDLGEEMGQDLPLVMARPSSVPPSPTRAEFNHNSRVVRHGSLPPPPKGSKLPKITFPRPVEHVIEETEDELNNKDNSDSESVRMIRVTEPPGQNSKTPNAQVNPAEDTVSVSRNEGDNEVLVVPVSIASDGKVIPRMTATIKYEKTKTRWFYVWSESAISVPYTLHTSVTLELGDLFINQFFSKKRQELAYQIWVIVELKNEFWWRQVIPNQKTYHPKLRDRILAFLPDETKNAPRPPTWIKEKSARPSRVMPLIV